MASARLKVRVQPGARRSEVLGWQDDALRVRVPAPPIEGRANQALVELLADVLGVPKSRISVQAGHASRQKVVAVEGLDADELARRLPPRPSIS